MKIGIHSSKGTFSDRWIAYCEEYNIRYKIVDCFKSDIITQLDDCDALMWHFSQNSPKAILFAKQLLYSVEASGKKVFPDFRTVWHFDDKAGQKYLLESIKAPLVPTWIFYSKKEAMHFLEETAFPKVFKLRGGAGSQNVRLVKSAKEAAKLIRKSFGRGFPAYDPIGSLKERWRLYLLKKTNFIDLIEGVARFVVPPPYARVRGRENGYIYFQEFITDNNSDTRVIVIGDRAYAIKRMVRENDFRASGSGRIVYNNEQIDKNAVRIAFETSSKLDAQCLAYDFIFQNNIPMIVEISFGFAIEAYDACPGYWDKELEWHPGKFNPQAWMVEHLVKCI